VNVSKYFLVKLY